MLRLAKQMEIRKASLRRYGRCVKTLKPNGNSGIREFRRARERACCENESRRGPSGKYEHLLHHSRHLATRRDLLQLIQTNNEQLFQKIIVNGTWVTRQLLMEQETGLSGSIALLSKNAPGLQFELIQLLDNGVGRTAH